MPVAIAAYLAAMRRRVHPARALVYVAIRPVLRPRPAWKAIRGVIACQLPGTQLLDFGTAFADAADYEQRWPLLLGELAGLVIVADPGGYIGQGAGRELRACMAARLRVLLVGPRRLVALPECRIGILPGAERMPSRHLRIAPGRAGLATTVSLRAIGVCRKKPGANGRRPT